MGKMLGLISTQLTTSDFNIDKDIQKEIKGLGKVEQVLLDTADSVMDTKRKIEFGVQQIVFKVSIAVL